MHHFLRKIGYTRKNVMSLMRLLGGKADVLRGFTKRCNENYKVTPRMDIGLYLGDIQDHVVTMMTNLTNYEKMLSRAHSNYLAQLSIDSITQGTSTNRTLSKITIIASIIVPLNVITGLFGMNVKVPWFNGDPGRRQHERLLGHRRRARRLQCRVHRYRQALPLYIAPGAECRRYCSCCPGREELARQEMDAQTGLDGEELDLWGFSVMKSLP